MTFTPPSLHLLKQALDDPKNPVGMRMRAAYYLRQQYENPRNEGQSEKNEEDKVGQCADGNNLRDEVLQTLGENLCNRSHGSLLRHEFAYVMGQLKDKNACTYLEAVLDDDNDCVMVRHECAEALGAIGKETSLEVLQKYARHERPELSQTCQIAVDFINWKKGQLQESGAEEEKKEGLPPVMACACMLSPYKSVDPAPPLSSASADTSAKELGDILRDTSLDLFPRYRAMFTLRNMNTKESAEELGNTLICDDSSALLRHEVAYVLGQMQNPACIPMLIKSLERDEEHSMVRHESAEALGAMCDVGGEAWDVCEKALRSFQHDSDVVVAESCEVALDAADYWGLWTSQ